MPDPRSPKNARQQLAAFYAANAERVRATVVARTFTYSEDVIDDACQRAWLILIRREDIPLDSRGLSWLITVAVREAWRIARPRDVPFGAFRGEDTDEHELPEPESLDTPVEDQAEALFEHEERVARLRDLKPVQRRDLLLKAAGFSYGEIAEATDSSYSSVNRHLSEGRAGLRAAARRERKK